MSKPGYVYIMANVHHTTLYVGVTSYLPERILKHKEHYYPRSFTARYNVTKLVYFECLDSIVDAIRREKQLKGGSRKAKELLIQTLNPEWTDLFETVKRW